VAGLPAAVHVTQVGHRSELPGRAVVRRVVQALTTVPRDEIGEDVALVDVVRAARACAQMMMGGPPSFAARPSRFDA